VSLNKIAELYDGEDGSVKQSASTIQGAVDLVAQWQSFPDTAILADFTPREGYIYTVTRAISARVNQNFDGFPSEELHKSYASFLGKPCFVNHANHDPQRARGRVVAARYVENGLDKYVDVIQEISAVKYPKLAKELLDGGLDSVSMGCEAQRTICSFCGNEATGMFDMCAHILNAKGRYLRRKAANGGMEDVLVYEECRDLSFFELSYVFDPADETAVVSTVLTANRKTAFPKTQKCKFCADHATQRVIHSEGMAYVPACDKHLTKARNAAASCTPDGSHDESNIDRVEAIAKHAKLIQRVWCDLPGCRRWTVYNSDTYNEWVNGHGELRTYDYCCEGHRQQYEDQYPSWAFEARIRNPHKAQAMEKHGFGEVEAPTPVDTLRDESEDEKDDFHRYVESPPELNEPDLDAAGEIDRRQEMPEGFENFDDEVFDTVDEGVSPDATAPDAPGELPGVPPGSPGGVGTPPTIPRPGPGEAPLGDVPGENAAPLPGEEALPSADALPGVPEDVMEDPGDAEEEIHPEILELDGVTPESTPPEDIPDEVAPEVAPVGPAPEDAVPVDEVMQDPGDPSPPVPGVDAPTPKDIVPADDVSDDVPVAPVEPPVPPVAEEAPQPDTADTPDVPVDPTDTVDPKTPATPAVPPTPDVDDDVMKDPGDASPDAPGDAPPDVSPEVPPEDVHPEIEQLELLPGVVPPPEPESDEQHRSEDDSRSNEQSTTPTKGRRNMGTNSLAERGRVASRGRVADQSRNDQGEKEDTFITQTPPPEPVVAPNEDGPISNTEENLVASIRARQRALKELRAKKARRKQADETADVVNPELSGTGDQDLKGDFESADPDDGVEETQPKDAARHAALVKRYRHFSAWCRATQGKSIREARHAGELRRWARSYAGEFKIDPATIYPMLSRDMTALRKKAADEGVSAPVKADPAAVKDEITSSTRKTAGDDDLPDFLKDDEDKKESRRKQSGEVPDAFKDQWDSDDGDDSGDEDDKKESARKTADDKLDVAAPDGRVDVEAPTSDTTDDEAQASQFDTGDFGDNAGDDLADPDMSTDQNWAPGEGKKSSRAKTATGLQAVRLAEAYIEAGLEPKEARWKLATSFQEMSQPIVLDRIALLERVAAVRVTERKTAGVRGSSRITNAVPANLGRQTATTMPREAANGAGVGNPDSDMFL